MVYCGRPSTSCNNCRAKRRRCDKALPGCGQCRRKGQQCPGYPDPASLIFRDESNQVIHKARARITKRVASREHTPGEAELPTPLAQDILNEDPLFAHCTSEMLGANLLQVQNTSPDGGNAGAMILGNSTSLWSRVGNENTGDAEIEEEKGGGSEGRGIVPPPFALPLDMAGLNYFLTHHVVRKSAFAPGFLDYTVSILSMENGHEILEGAILAVGYAGLAHNTRQIDLMYRARAMYTRTIKQMNRALADPRAARRDGTIVTVLILSLYEFSESSLDGWERHIQGATSLLELRGKVQFGTPVGLQIFIDVFSHLLINCLRMGSPIPSSLRMLRAEAAKAISASDPYWVASSGLIEIMDIYRQISPGGFNFINSSSTARSGATKTDLPIDELERHLSQALDIDHRLESRFSECSPEWQFTVVQNPGCDPTRVHGDVYHSYHDVSVSGIWNDMRTCRILANHAICYLLLRGAKSDPSWFFTGNYADQLQQVSRKIIGLRDDVLASVPQLMSYFPFPAQKQSQPLSRGPPFDETTTGIEQATHTGSAVGAYFASWMLLLVGSMHSNSEETRQWIVTQLRRINLQSGLAQADFFAGCIESKQVRPPLSF